MTKQEYKDKVKKMLNICIDPMCDSKDCDNHCDYCDYNCCQDYLCRDALFVIEEQENEIERLRTTLGQCNTELNSALESLKSQCREIGELKAKVKQAKIDVLNELKKKTHNYYPSIDNYCISQHVVLVRDIDELIKEIENEN